MNLNSVVGKMSRINIFNIKGEKLCQESLQDPTLLQILLLLRVKCVPNQKKPTSLQVMLGTYLNGDEQSMYIALPEVT